jgi:hypothetical protein
MLPSSMSDLTEDPVLSGIYIGTFLSLFFVSRFLEELTLKAELKSFFTSVG